MFYILGGKGDNENVLKNLVKTDISAFECSPDIWNKKALERNQGRPIRQIPSQIPCLMNLRVPPWLKVENFQPDLNPKSEVFEVSMNQSIQKSYNGE